MRTPVTSAWPPAESLPRPRIREEEGELSALMRGMMNAQANDNGWPTFSGKFVEYPRFRQPPLKARGRGTWGRSFAKG
jgi:hypothetical protein